MTGFDEISPEQVRENIVIDEMRMLSKANNRTFQFGYLETPTLSELKEQAPPIGLFEGDINLNEIVGNVQELHADPVNESALFQAASQFNLLEMAGPHITPEEGVDIYESDYTQGPACAIACGAGTIYRNYFVPVNGKVGQTASNQIDCLELIGEELNNEKSSLWKMTNGYALFNKNGLLKVNSMLSKLTDAQREILKGKLKIGLQWNTEVTIAKNKQLVSQAFCSALPVAYSHIEPVYWEKFARVILEAVYEATLYATLINLEKTGSNKVFLTLVGGGAFGNEPAWIVEAIANTVKKFINTPLDIKIVSYGSSNLWVQKLLQLI